ncbi:hypothetical protein ACROYT_G026011 [Oculina patagonica]
MEGGNSSTGKSRRILILLLSPDQICLHVRTNDLRSTPTNENADAIVELSREIEGACEAEIIVSELTTRKDANDDAVKAVNRCLKQFCRQNNWKLVSHSNIASKGHNKGGLHLNKEGSHYKSTVMSQ